MKEFDQAAKYFEKASGMYHESGHGDTAGQVLTKAAKWVVMLRSICNDQIICPIFWTSIHMVKLSNNITPTSNYTQQKIL